MVLAYLEFVDSFSWGSACSRTECPAHVLKAIERVALKDCNRTVKFSHMFSAEILPRKRGCIIITQALRDPGVGTQLFRDMKDLLNDFGYGHVSGETVIPRVAG